MRLLLLVTAVGLSACTSVHQPAAVERLPFTSARNLVLVSGSVNALPCSFLVDTGAAQTMLDARLAQRAGAQPGAAAWQRGYGAATVPSRVLSGVTVQLGNVRMPLAGARSAPPVIFESIGKLAGHRIDGVLGQELFQRYVVAIDYPNRLISLYEPGTELKPSGGQMIPLAVGHGYVVVNATARPSSASESIPCRLVVDTGSNDQVVLRQQFLDAHPAAFSGWSTTRLGQMHGVG